MCGCAAEYVEVNVEPVVDLLVNRVVLIAELLRCDLFFNGFCFCSGAVFICAANKEGI